MLAPSAGHCQLWGVVGCVLVGGEFGSDGFAFSVLEQVAPVGWAVQGPAAFVTAALARTQPIPTTA